MDVPVAPGLIVRLLGLAVTVNSGPGHAAADGTRNPRKPCFAPLASCEHGAVPGTLLGTYRIANSNKATRGRILILKLMVVSGYYVCCLG